MSDLSAFLSNNAGLLVAVVALLVSLRANHTAQAAHRLNVQNKVDTTRVLLAEKKRETLNELDCQYTRMATLSLLTAQKILLFKESPTLHETLSDEFVRLKSNLVAVQTLSSRYEEQRRGIEEIGLDSDVATQEELLGKIRRLTIHIEKDIAHEQADLEDMRKRVARK